MYFTINTILIIIGLFSLLFILQGLSEGENTMEWEEATALYDKTVEEALAIIDDAECNGFEFKYESGHLFFREGTPEH